MAIAARGRSRILRAEFGAWWSAHLLDRIRMFKGRPQVYGTQHYA